MGVLVFAAPALLVVVLGYAVGYAVAGWLGASPAASEGIGWVAGLILLGAVVGALVRRRRRRRSGWE